MISEVLFRIPRRYRSILFALACGPWLATPGRAAFHAGEVNACRSPQWPNEATSSLISVLYSPTLPDGEAIGLSSLNQLFRWTLSEGWVQVGAGLSEKLKSILGFSPSGSLFVKASPAWVSPDSSRMAPWTRASMQGS